jgi:proteasome lid subunit RPN8/RPN11
MDFAYISRKHLAILKKHANRTFPNECIGVFSGYKDDGGFYITDIYECHNIARKKRTSGLLSRKVFNGFNKIAKNGSKTGVFLGVYHSHPVSGQTQMGEQDMYSGSIYRLFRLQIILGVRKSGIIKTAFWEIKNKKWCESVLKIRSMK